MISVLYFPPTKIGMTTTDPIYGEFTLPPNLQRAMKHPAFQRLDRIAQLGFSMFCPGMEHLRHTRAEHSKGVAYLAGVLGEILNLEPPDTELLQMTALLHDSGHGPFSHSFELVTPLRHEIRSQQVAALILEDIYSPEQISSVCYLIDPHGEAPTPNAAMLCDIVANKRCDVDIDKLDYLMRDSYYAGIPFGALNRPREKCYDLSSNIELLCLRRCIIARTT
jgi:HD superfamily phosphohydrolase